MPDHHTVAVTGKVAHVFGHRFVVETDQGVMLAFSEQTAPVVLSKLSLFKGGIWCSCSPRIPLVTTSVLLATSAPDFPGLLEVRSKFVVEDNGLLDAVCPAAQQWDIDALPGDVLPFLLAGRYRDTEKLLNLAWSLFGGIPGGWQRAQAISDYVH